MERSKEELQRMEQADIRDAVLDKPVVIGGYTVQIGYADCAETLSDRMKEYIRKVAEIRY